MSKVRLAPRSDAPQELRSDAPTLAQSIERIRRLEHRVAVLQFATDRLFRSFFGDDIEDPAVAVAIAGRGAELADDEAVFEVVRTITQAKDSAVAELSTLLNSTALSPSHGGEAPSPEEAASIERRCKTVRNPGLSRRQQANDAHASTPRPPVAVDLQQPHSGIPTPLFTSRTTK